MLQRSQIGSRIRSIRVDQGRSQKDLAKAAGISPSYLNLIEHNRRRIGGGVLQAIATELGVEASRLASPVDAELLEHLDANLADGVEPPQQFLDRFPGWAHVVAEQARQVERLKSQLASLSDRMTHDLHLSGALHQVLSTVTSIRSSASILVDGAGDRDWEARFHRNIHEDSRRLADVSQALVSYLEEQPNDARALGAEEELAAFLDARGYHLAELEEGREVDQTGLGPAAKSLAAPMFAQYAQDVAALPMNELDAVAAACAYNPFEVSQRMGRGLSLVFRRLASLPSARGRPAMGLAICDGAGCVRTLKRIDGFSIETRGGACPIWPLFQALFQPGRPIKDVVALSNDRAPRLSAYALAEFAGSYDPGQPAVVTSTMLVVADAPKGRVRLLGKGCGGCDVANCGARRETARASKPLSL